jgi:hypothetical protein
MSACPRSCWSRCEQSGSSMHRRRLLVVPSLLSALCACGLALRPCRPPLPPHTHSLSIPLLLTLTPPQVTEGTSVQDCGGVFAYLDSRTAAFKSPALAEARCRNTLLRTCNMLLKRLSKVGFGASWAAAALTAAKEWQQRGGCCVWVGGCVCGIWGVRGQQLSANGPADSAPGRPSVPPLLDTHTLRVPAAERRRAAVRPRAALPCQAAAADGAVRGQPDGGLQCRQRHAGGGGGGGGQLPGSWQGLGRGCRQPVRGHSNRGGGVWAMERCQASAAALSGLPLAAPLASWRRADARGMWPPSGMLCAVRWPDHCAVPEHARALRRPTPPAHTPAPTRAHARHLGAVPQGALDSEGQPVDAAFYRTFWGLQAFFRWAPHTRLQEAVAWAFNTCKVSADAGRMRGGSAWFLSTPVASLPRLPRAAVCVCRKQQLCAHARCARLPAPLPAATRPPRCSRASGARCRGTCAACWRSSGRSGLL